MGEMIEFPSNGHTCAGYLAVPGGGSGPGVVVIQEYWGLVGHIKELCDRLAAAGFVALAPDLYHGRTAEPKEPDKAGKLLMEMQLDEAARDMGGAVRWLAGSDKTAGDRVGIVGFCMGGALALYAASLAPAIGAVVTFYPYLMATDRAKPDYGAIRAAVLGHFATEDQAYTRDQIDRLAEQLRVAGLDVEFHWYQGADHAFFNDTRPEVYDAAASETAWERTLQFFRTHLATTAAPV